MARVATEDSERMAMRLLPTEKKLIMRAAALQNMDLSQFVLQNTLAAARDVIQHEEQFMLGDRDSFRVLELLENPPIPSEKLIAAVRSLPREE